MLSIDLAWLSRKLSNNLLNLTHIPWPGSNLVTLISLHEQE